MQNKKTISVIVCSSLLWLIMTLVTAILMIVTIISLPIKAKIRHKLVVFSWGMAFTFLAKYLCKVDYVVYGQENLPKTPVIFASNHQSMWETIALITILPQHVWILKRELFKIPMFGWALSVLSPIAINRDDPVAAIQQVSQQSVKRIKAGFSILVFPEGTRVKPGVVQPYKNGVSKMALALKLPIIPIIHNAGYFVPKNSFFLYPGKVTVIIDKPIITKDYTGTPEELTEELQQIINSQLKTITYQ